MGCEKIKEPQYTKGKVWGQWIGNVESRKRAIANMAELFGKPLLMRVSTNKIREWSSGEVQIPDTVDWLTGKPAKGGLFCERIFGADGYYNMRGGERLLWAIFREKMYSKCLCGITRGESAMGTICENCGTKVKSRPIKGPRFIKGLRMGHIELAEPISYWNRKLKVLPVLPVPFRPMAYLGDNRFMTSSLNDYYRRILTRNIRLRRLLKMKAPRFILKNERDMLEGLVLGLLGDKNGGQPCQPFEPHMPFKSLKDLFEKGDIA